MEYGLSIFASTASLTSSGTAVATPIPFDTQGGFPRHIRVSTTANCYVAVGDLGVTAVAGDMLLQAGDAQLLHVSDCKAISILSVSGSATVNVAAMELGNWSTDQRTLDYDFTALAAVPSPVTFTRASNATYFNSSGVLTTASNNVPRLDYDPATLLPRGLLVEEQRTNICIYNNDLSNAIWTTKTNLTLGTGIVSPTGATDAFRLTATGVLGAWQQVCTVIAANVYTGSVWVRRVSGSGAITLRCCELVGTTIVPTSTWQRFSFTNTASSVNGRIGITTTNADDVIEVFGFQLETTAALGSATFVTSYIPTTTAGATRSADSVSMTGTNFSSWWPVGSGTFYCEHDSAATATTSTRAWQAYNTAANLIQVADSSSGQVVGQKVYNSTVVSANSAAYSQNTVFKTCVSHDTSNINISVNGAAVVTTAAGAFTVEPNALWLGSASGAVNILNGHIRRFTAYAPKLPSATLQSLTA